MLLFEKETVENMTAKSVLFACKTILGPECEFLRQSCRGKAQKAWTILTKRIMLRKKCKAAKGACLIQEAMLSVLGKA